MISAPLSPVRKRASGRGSDIAVVAVILAVVLLGWFTATSRTGGNRAATGVWPGCPPG
jgi:hypothetical protein